MEEKKFDLEKYKQDWKKANMKRINFAYKAEFVDEFKEACKKLNLSLSEVVRQAMIDTIERAKK